MSQLSVFLGSLGLSMILAGVAGLGIASSAGMSLEEPQFMFQPKNAPTLQLIQAVSAFMIFGLPAILFAFVCYSNSWTALGLGKPGRLSLAIISFILILSTVPLTDALGILNKAIPLSPGLRAYFDQKEAAYEAQVKLMLELGNPVGLMKSLLLVAILPGIVEELFFRGALQGMLHRWWGKPWVAIVVTSVIFSAIHFSWYGFIPRVMLGMVLGTVFYISGNLWLSILMHVVNNAIGVVYLFVQQQQGNGLDSIQTSFFPVWAGAFSVVAVVGLLAWMMKLSPPVAPKEVMYRRNYPFAPAEEKKPGDNP